MLRRTLLGLILLQALPADERQDVTDLFASLAAALSGGDPYDFMASFESSMPGYSRFRADISALLDQNEVLTSIELESIRVEGSGAVVTADWLLEIRSRQPAGPLTRRDEKVTCKLTRRKGKWRIVALDPQSLFSPPR